MSEQIFVSYRRDGGDVTAKLICEALKNAGYTVFYDYDSISGGYFDSRILDAIEACNDFVLVLPPHSLERCVNEDDWVRQEISHALRHKKNIIPVLLPGFAFPDNMPSDIADVARYNGVQFVMAYFDGVIDTLKDRFISKAARRSFASKQKNSGELIPSEGLAFEANSAGTGYIVKKGKCTDVEIVIPRVYNGKAVTGIAEDAFKGHTSLVSIKIPNGVTSIGEGAFNGCASLANIDLPNSMASIGRWAFQDCTALTSIFLPRNISSVASRAFLNCQSLTSIEVDPENNFYVSRGGHLYTKNMKTFVCYAMGRNETSYVVPEGVTKIENSSFSRAGKLVSISLPESVVSIGEYSFYRCVSLTEMEVPKGVTVIPASAFSTCSALASITLPSGIVSIGAEAFINCSSLTSIVLPAGVTVIETKAFKKCTSLRRMVLPAGLMAISEQMFMNCSALENIVIPPSVTSIGPSAFSNCTLLANISLPEGLMSLGKWAFEECTSLTGIFLPKRVSSIGPRVFLNCISLVSIDVSPENNFYCSVNGHLYTKDMKTMVSYAIGCKNSFYDIPKGVKVIEDSAFSRCASLVNVTIPAGVTSIGMFAFYRCSSITNINLPESLTSIGDSAFRECKSLTSIKIPNGVTRLGESVFDNCQAITSIKLPSSITSIGKWAFSTCPSLREITIPRNVSSIGARVLLGGKSLKCIHVSMLNRYYKSHDGHLYTKDMSLLVSYAMGNNMPSYEIPFGVKRIEESAFSGAPSLMEITIPGTVMSMGDFAFYNCSALRVINYLSTKGAWRSISVGKDTFSKVTNTVIHCTDGDIVL
ncbi:MAG: leucine-rich repeat protein [Clostridia bacterium]|nr:leucine-rich repeat protein [Clostridia bacterium]